MGKPIKRHVTASVMLIAVVACGPAAEQIPTPEPEDNAGSLAPEPVVTYRGSLVVMRLRLMTR